MLMDFRPHEANVLIEYLASVLHVIRQSKRDSTEQYVSSDNATFRQKWKYTNAS